MGGTVELHATSGRTMFALVLPIAQRDAGPSQDGERFPVETERPHEREPTVPA
jgi:hypothetical protein